MRSLEEHQRAKGAAALVVGDPAVLAANPPGIADRPDGPA